MITSQVQATDAIVEPYTDDIGNKVFIPTQAFFILLNEMAESINSKQTSQASSGQDSGQDTTGGTTEETTIVNIENIINHALIAELEFAISGNRRDNATLKKEIAAMRGKIEEQQLLISSLEAEQRRLSTKLRNLEHVYHIG